MNTTKTDKIFLIISIIAGSLLLLTLVLCLLLIPKKEPPPETTPTTEATQPPIPANPFTPMDFGYRGQYLTCLTAESVLGIDVSSYQGQIDWQQVKDAGIKFVMIRIGYRGMDLGGLYADEWAQQNYEGAKAAGLAVGGYFFSQAVSVEEAREEALYALEITKDWLLDMPLVYDWEYTGDENRIAGVDARLMTDCTKAFCQAVEEAGKTPMIYFNPGQSRDLMYLDELTDYGFWLAMYTDQMEYEHKVDMWQYTCEGAVPGIEGNVDINLYFPG